MPTRLILVGIVFSWKTNVVLLRIKILNNIINNYRFYLKILLEAICNTILIVINIGKRSSVQINISSVRGQKGLSQKYTFWIRLSKDLKIRC